MMNPNRSLGLGLLVLGVALLGVQNAGAVAYSSGDALFVAYQPHGRELIADLGPISNLTGASGPVALPQVSASDLAEVFGSPLPGLNITLLASGGPDSYFATNGPTDASQVGSAIGASSQIRFFGGNTANLSHALASGNTSAGFFEFGEQGSYQVTLNAAFAGSIGNNVPFSTESPFGGTAQSLSINRGQFNPFVGGGAHQSLVGRLAVAADGTITYQPIRQIQATCVPGPSTFNPKAQGAGFNVTLTLTDVTDAANPTPVDISSLDPVYVSQVGDVTLPVPFSGAGCTAGQDGIWETPGQRVGSTINFLAPSDGNCSTQDGNRQDIQAVLGAGTGNQAICVASSVGGNPVACCSTVRVLEKARR
jgi:hypothetical protein